jgi:hypothetical protein
MPFFSVAVELNPITKETGDRMDSDLAVKLLLDPLHVVANIPFFLSIGTKVAPSFVFLQAGFLTCN